MGRKHEGRALSYLVLGPLLGVDPQAQGPFSREAFEPGSCGQGNGDCPLSKEIPPHHRWRGRGKGEERRGRATGLNELGGCREGYVTQFDMA